MSKKFGSGSSYPSENDEISLELKKLKFFKIEFPHGGQYNDGILWLLNLSTFMMKIWSFSCGNWVLSLFLWMNNRPHQKSIPILFMMSW